MAGEVGDVLGQSQERRVRGFRDERVVETDQAVALPVHRRVDLVPVPPGDADGNALRYVGPVQRGPEHGDLFTLLWPSLNRTDVPQSVPVCITGRNRDQIYATMNRKGYGLVSLYHTLIAEA